MAAVDTAKLAVPLILKQTMFCVWPHCIWADMFFMVVEHFHTTLMSILKPDN